MVQIITEDREFSKLQQSWSKSIYFWKSFVLWRLISRRKSERHLDSVQPAGPSNAARTSHLTAPFGLQLFFFFSFVSFVAPRRIEGISARFTSLMDTEASAPGLPQRAAYLAQRSSHDWQGVDQSARV